MCGFTNDSTEKASPTWQRLILIFTKLRLTGAGCTTETILLGKLTVMVLNYINQVAS